METKNKTVSLNLSVNQYEHLTELARLVETVTDVPTGADAIANKLFEKALASLNIGKQSITPEASPENFEMVNGLEPHIDQSGIEEPPAYYEQEYEEPRADSLEPVIEEKASPQAIYAVVSSLQANAKQREQIVMTTPFKFTGTWGKLLGQIEPGSTVGIVAYDRYRATSVALSLCHELNRELNVLYIAPSIIGDYHELVTPFGIGNEPRPKQTKVIHYCPQNALEWKRVILDEHGNAKFQVVIADAAHEAGISSASDMRIPFIANTSSTRSVITISTMSSLLDFETGEGMETVDVALRVEDDGSVLVKRNSGQ